jgi:hypothetical protein
MIVWTPGCVQARIAARSGGAPDATGVNSWEMRMLSRKRAATRVAFYSIVSLLAVSSALPAADAPTKPSMAQGVHKLPYVRLYSGRDGVSHFAAEALILSPPQGGGQGLEATLATNRIGDVKGATFALLKAGTTEDWHVAPRRQFMLCVRGIVEITAGDGTKRRMRPGQFMLLEDTTGKGHITHSAGPEDHVALAIPVPDGVPAKQ